MPEILIAYQLCWSFAKVSTNSKLAIIKNHIKKIHEIKDPAKRKRVQKKEKTNHIRSTQSAMGPS